MHKALPILSGQAHNNVSLAKLLNLHLSMPEGEFASSSRRQFSPRLTYLKNVPFEDNI